MSPALTHRELAPQRLNLSPITCAPLTPQLLLTSRHVHVLKARPCPHEPRQTLGSLPRPTTDETNPQQCGVHVALGMPAEIRLECTRVSQNQRKALNTISPAQAKLCTGLNVILHNVQTSQVLFVSLLNRLNTYLTRLDLLGLAWLAGFSSWL